MARTKRKALSQKIRFEVFKRDSFQCQYCGRKAPDVVLQVDHIVPVAKGGTNDILNLVTSCVECNQGKSDRRLSDQSVVERQRREMELRQERLEQIRMLGEWQASLVDVRDAEIEEVQKLFSRLTGGKYRMSDGYVDSKCKKLLSRFGLQAVLQAMRDGFDSYGDESKTLEKLGGICANNADPELHLKTRVLCAMKKRFSGFYWLEANRILSVGKNLGGIEFLEKAMAKVYSLEGGCYWKHIKHVFEDLVDQYETF